MGALIGSIIMVIIVATFFWYLLSPIFFKVGSFTRKKAKNFKKKWEEKENE